MLVLFILILLIITLGYLLGHMTLQKLGVKSTNAIHSSWFGTILLSIISTAIALFGGLNPVNGSFLVLFVLFVSRDIIKAEWTRVFSSATIGVIFVVLVVAWYINQPIFWYDSGLYHIQAIKWISEHGYVWGLGLLHTRLGVISSWFALPAYFNHYTLAGSVYALMGGVALVMALLHLTSAITNIFSTGGRLSDRFTVFAYLLASIEIFKWGIAISPTPDLPIIVLSIVLGSMFVDMLDSDDEADKKSLSVAIALLAFASATVKLSVAPIAVIAVYFVWKYHKNELKSQKNLLLIVALVLLLLPNMIASFKTTGSLWYPLPLVFDVSWGLSVETAKSEMATIKEWAKWEGGKPVGAPELGFLLPKYKADVLATGRIYQFLLGFWSLASFAVLLTVAAWKAKYKYVLFVLLSFALVIFFYMSAPTLRFGLGILVWLPAFSLALWRQGRVVKNECSGYEWASYATSAMVLVIFFKLVGHASIEDGVFRQLAQKQNIQLDSIKPIKHTNIQPGFRLVGQKPILTPMPLEVQLYSQGRLTYVVPKSDGMCWDYVLPCTNAEQKELALRDKSVGIAGGFSRR